MRSTWIATGVPDRARSIEEFAILSVDNPDNQLQVSRHVVSTGREFGDDRLMKWMRY